jgi:nucleotide-binding universal stress UspA family protein
MKAEIRNVLAATDLTEAGEMVLQSAAALASRSGATLHVLHAYGFNDNPYVPPAEPITFQELVRAAEEGLAEQLRRAVPADVHVGSRHVVIYIAHKAIVEQARAVNADVIVLGAHRPRAFADGVLGSTADQVIRSASVPCLVLRAPLALPLARVLVPVDGSDLARGALGVALAWAGALGQRGGDSPGAPTTRVDILHVAPDSGLAVHPMSDHEMAEADAAVNGARSGNERLSLHRETALGDTAGGIVAAARQTGAGLLVLGTQGHGALYRAFVGSTASAVARTAPCPVLLVPPAPPAGAE